MFKYKFIIIFISLIFLSSCGQEVEKKVLIKESNQKVEMISAYKEAMNLLEVGDYFAASKKFLEAEILFPQSRWAPRSVLMASYSYYMQDYYSLAIESLKRYFQTYPKDENMAYAHYLLAICYYDTIEGEKKDLAPLILSKNEFNFPDNFVKVQVSSSPSQLSKGLTLSLRPTFRPRGNVSFDLGQISIYKRLSSHLLADSKSQDRPIKTSALEGRFCSITSSVEILF